jgi:hypothetical protein
LKESPQAINVFQGQRVVVVRTTAKPARRKSNPSKETRRKPGLKCVVIALKPSLQLADKSSFAM